MLRKAEEEPCSRKNILLNYPVFCSFRSFFNCYSSVPVLMLCEFTSLKRILDKFRFYRVSQGKRPAFERLLLPDLYKKRYLQYLIK